LRRLLGLIVALVAAGGVAACGGADEPDLVIYSGRAEPLIKPFLDEFAERERLDVRVRFGDTAALVGTLLEEGRRTRADVFIGQDAAALARLDSQGMLQPYPGARRTPARFRARNLTWTGLSGRARVLIVRRGVEAPRSVFELTGPRWKGEVAAPAPSNVSFRDWVSAIRLERGDAFARRYLERLKANDLAVLADHGQVRNAVGEGEFDVGLVNHYYVELERREGSPVRAVYTDQERGGFGTLVNAASAGITRSAAHPENARKLLAYLLSPEVQRRFARANFEYPLLPGLEPAPGVRPLDRVRMSDVPLERLGDAADGTDRLLDEVDLGG
jgi:iron(III) transport system substrate-binding protein